MSEVPTRKPVSTRPRINIAVIRRLPSFMTSLLLVVEAGGLLALTILYGMPFLEVQGIYLSVALFICIIYGLSGILALVAAVGLLLSSHSAWFSAMLVQGACLMVALLLYFQERTNYVYTVMIYCSMMVFYLNFLIERAPDSTDLESEVKPHER